jgi:hypothetical protein
VRLPQDAEAAGLEVDDSYLFNLDGEEKGQVGIINKLARPKLFKPWVGVGEEIVLSRRRDRWGSSASAAQAAAGRGLGFEEGEGARLEIRCSRERKFKRPVSQRNRGGRDYCGELCKHRATRL